MSKIKTILLLLIILPTVSGAEVILESERSAIGARALGMGRAFVALTGEPDSLFLNPAALATISGRGFTAMYSKAQGISNHYLLGAVTSGTAGTFGAGFHFFSIFGPPNATQQSNGTLGLIDSGPNVNYYSSTLNFAYARTFFERINAGINIKIFQHAFTNQPGIGNGVDSDIGLLYSYDEHLSFGFLQRNFLAGLGSKIKWYKRYYEVIPNSTRFGASYSYDKFIFSADYEFYPSSNRMGIFMFGVQYLASPDLTVRTGMDQLDPTINNFTGGFSYSFGPARLDYALHQYSPSSLNSSAFSLSYLAPLKGLGSTEAALETPSQELIALDYPMDQSITAESSLVFSGRVLPAVASLEINGRMVSLEAGSFAATLPLALGKNSFLLITYDRAGRKTELKKIRILNLPPFPDVTEDHFAYYPIGMMDLLGIVTGGRDGRFNPEGTVTRSQLAQILENMAETGQFKTVTTEGQLADPNYIISRADLVTAMVRLTDLPRPEITTAPFPDVPGRYWAAEEINAARLAGWLQYWEGKKFQPDKKITRAELCHILSRIEPVRSLIAQSFDFSRGY